MKRITVADIAFVALITIGTILLALFTSLYFAAQRELKSLTSVGPVHKGDTVIIALNDGLKTCGRVVDVSPSGRYIQINNCDYILDRERVLEVVEHQSCEPKPGKTGGRTNDQQKSSCDIGHALRACSGINSTKMAPSCERSVSGQNKDT